MSEQLKACPKCKSTQIIPDYLISDGRDHPVRMKCDDCRYAEDYWSDTEEDAIKQWNIRLIEDALRATLARLTQERDDWHKMADKLAKNHQARNKQGAYCRLCGVLDLGVEKHTPECPVTEYRALIARYSQHEEEK